MWMRFLVQQIQQVEMRLLSDFERQQAENAKNERTNERLKTSTIERIKTMHNMLKVVNLIKFINHILTVIKLDR